MHQAGYHRHDIQNYDRLNRTLLEASQILRADL